MRAFLLASLAATLSLPALAQPVSTSGSQVYVQSTALAAGGSGGNGHLWTTPNVGGSYFAGANNCLVGVGGGASRESFGFSFTWGRNSEDCVRRSDAGAWHSLGLDNVAIARMCQDGDNAKAFLAATGRACPGTAGATPVAVAAPPVPPSAPAAVVAAAPEPAWCASARARGLSNIAGCNS